MMILIQTAAGNFDARENVRATWKKDCDLAPFCSCVFVTGISPNSERKTRRLLSKEASEYQDIVQTDIMDTYNNLTLKTLFSIQ